MFKQLMSVATILAATTAYAGGHSAATEITLWHAMGGQLGEITNELANRFNASQSDYKLTPVYKGGYEDTMTAGIAAFRAKQQPHVIQIFDAGAATIINAKGAVLPVEDLLNQYGVGFDANNYIAGVRNFYADNAGTMVGMPFNSSTPVLYYNKEAFTKAGLTLPPATWEDFETRVAPALKKAGYVALAQSHTPWIFSENFHSRHNLQMATANNGFGGLNAEILYNNPAMQTHFQKLVDWQKEGFYKYYGRAWGDNQAPFAAGEVAMWLGSSGSFGGLKQAAKFEFGTTYLPYWAAITNEPTGTFIGGAALFAMSGHDKKAYEGVAKFFEFLTNPEIQFYWHRETGYVPITNASYELAKSSGYYKENPDAEVGIQQLNLPVGDWSKGYQLGFYVQVREVMYGEYDKLFSGQQDVKTTFANIEKGGNELLRRFEKTYQ
jgi:sn-glycerol 3-phosphate transport system substrate-binding protein